MPRPITEKDVKALIAGIKQSGALVQAEQVQRLWDEVQTLRDREANVAMLHNLEGETY